MASMASLRARQIACVTAGCLLFAGPAWGQSGRRPQLAAQATHSGQSASTGRFVNQVYRDAAGDHKYVVFVPTGYTPAKRWPTILYLHGAASRGKDGRAQLVSGLAPVIKLRVATYPFLVVFPQCENTQSRLLGGWTDDPTEADRALKILDVVARDYSVDPSREILMGGSMGGSGAWDLAARTPDRWSALVAVAGGGKLDQAAKVAKIPVWAFHAINDPFVPLNVPREMIAAVREAGGRAFLSEVDERGHDISSSTFTQSALQDWLLDPTQDPKLEGLKWTKPDGYRSGIEEEIPFVPGAEVSQAVRVRLCNDVLESFAYALPQVLASRPMSRSMPSVQRSAKIGFVPFDLSLSGLHFQGHVERSQLLVQPPDRLLVRLGLRNVTMTISKTQMEGKMLLKASAGPMHVVIGHRAPVWLSASIRPRVENRRLKLDVVETDFQIPSDNWYVTEPSNVHVRGMPFLNGKMSDEMVNGVYSRKGEIERQVISSVKEMALKAEALANQYASQTLAFEALSMPIWQPRLRPWPEHVRIDEHGVTLVLGTTIGVLGHPERELTLRQYAPPAASHSVPIKSGLEVALSEQLLPAWTELIVAGRVNHFNSADFRSTEFRFLSDPKFLRQVIPDLERQGDQFEADIGFVLKQPLRLLDAKEPGPHSTSDAVRVGNSVRLSMPELGVAVAIRQPGEQQWKPCANFDLQVDRDYQPQILQSGFTARAIRAIPTSELRYEAQGAFAPGYEPQTPGIDIQRFASQVMLGRDGAQKSEGNKPLVKNDIVLAGVPFRLDEFTWLNGCLTLRAKVPPIVVTNDTEQTLTYETRGPFTDWSPSRALAPGKHDEFHVPYSLIWRRRLPTTTLSYTLPLGRVASSLDLPTPHLVLVKDVLEFTEKTEAPKSAQVDDPSKSSQ